MRLDIIFGSNSDEGKVLPGIVRATQQIPGLEVMVHYASADNTPDKVKKTVSMIKQSDYVFATPKIFTSGAGMSNVLTGVVRADATLNDLVIGVPITDSVTDGVSSVLSTSEKPPLNPVLTVGLNNTYAAINIAYRFALQKFENVSVLGHHPIHDAQSNEIYKAFDVFKLVTRVKTRRGVHEISPNDVVVSVYDLDCPLIQEVDERLRAGNGVQVFCSLEKPSDLVRYSHCLDRTEATGLVSATGYKNAVMMAAQLLRYQPALDVIAEMKDKKAKELEGHKGLYVKGGEVTKL
jgi:phosphoribosylcarboxyaminoimidazole (NCAIR) mutase